MRVLITSMLTRFAVFAAVVLLTPGFASAFTLNPGDDIIDIDFDSNATFVYNGATESFNIEADATLIKLDDGSTINVGPNELHLSLHVTLDPGTLSAFLFGPVSGQYSNGAADFTLLDLTGAPQVLMAGTFTTSALLQLNFGPAGLVAGDYDVLPGQGDPLFEAAHGASGNIGFVLSGLKLGTTPGVGTPATNDPCELVDGAAFFFCPSPATGLQNFTAFVAGDFSPEDQSSGEGPVPEPAFAWMLGIGLAVLWGAGRVQR